MNRLFRTLAAITAFVALSACGGSSDSGAYQSATLDPSPASGAGDPPSDPSSYTVTATVSGLSGSGLTLALNSDQPIPVAGNGQVTFPTTLADGAAYAVTVQAQPSGTQELCGVDNASGTIGGANVTNVAVTCAVMEGFLYRIEVVFGSSAPDGAVFSYGIAAGTGTLIPLGQAVATGALPMGVATSLDNRFLYIANETSSTISIYSVDPNTGALATLGSVATPQPGPMSMLMTAAGFLFVLGQTPGNVGCCATLTTFAVDATTGALTPAGSSLTFDPNTVANFVATPDGTILYLLTEGGGNNTATSETLTAYQIDSTTGALTAGPVLSWTTTWSSTTSPQTPMAMDPLGRYLYLVSSQSTLSVSAATVLPYAIDPATGALAPIGAGTSVASSPGTPGSMVVDPSGHYLYVLDQLNATSANHTVTTLAIDQSTGEVSLIGSAPTGGDPRSIAFDPNEQFMYVENQGAAGADPWSELASFAISDGTTAPAGQPLPISLFPQLPYDQGALFWIAVVK